MSTSDASRSTTTGAFPVVADERRHHLSARLGHRFPHSLQHRRVDRPDRAIQRRVRRNHPERARLGAKPFDVRARFTATGEHQHRLHQHLSAIMQPEPRRPNMSRQRLAHTEPIRQRPQRVQPHMGDDLLAPPSTTTGTVLLPFTCEVPSCSGLCCLRQAQFPLSGGRFRGRATLSSRNSVNDRG
jgi:hypothetical protein